MCLHFLQDKALPVTDSRHTDGGEVVSLTRQPAFTLKKIPGLTIYLQYLHFMASYIRTARNYVS
jgi:hypothetical protein